MSITHIPLKLAIFKKGEPCIFRNRHSFQMAQFDGKACEIIEIIPQEAWFDKYIPEYRIRFLEYRGKLNRFKIDENELERLLS